MNGQVSGMEQAADVFGAVLDLLRPAAQVLGIGAVQRVLHEHELGAEPRKHGKHRELMLAHLLDIFSRLCIL